MRIGVDLGGTKIEALALDDGGHELRRIRLATPQQDYPGTVAAIARLVQELERELHDRGTVGVGIPGTIVASTGLVKNANSTWLNGQPLERDLCKALEREVRCANDANCFAISEATDGAAAGVRIVFGVILGTGCGGGLAIEGTVHAGPNGLAGEWGHTPLPWPQTNEFPGLACYCGRHGCIETWISGPAFERDFQHMTGRSLRGAEIAAAAERGDEQAQACLVRLKDCIARGLTTVVNILDPDVIVLGGGLSRIDRLYDGEIERRMRDYAFGGGAEVKILRNTHGDSSGVRGAAWLWPAKMPTGSARALAGDRDSTAATRI